MNDFNLDNLIILMQIARVAYIKITHDARIIKFRFTIYGDRSGNVRLFPELDHDESLFEFHWNMLRTIEGRLSADILLYLNKLEVANRETSSVIPSVTPAPGESE